METDYSHQACSRSVAAQRGQRLSEWPVRGVLLSPRKQKWRSRACSGLPSSEILKLSQSEQKPHSDRSSSQTLLLFKIQGLFCLTLVKYWDPPAHSFPICAPWWSQHWVCGTPVLSCSCRGKMESLSQKGCLKGSQAHDYQTADMRAFSVLNAARQGNIKLSSTQNHRLIDAYYKNLCFCDWPTGAKFCICP